MMAIFKTVRGPKSDPHSQIPFDEIKDFQRSWDGKVQEAVRVCQVTYDDLETFLQAILPDVDLGNTTSLILDGPGPSPVYMGAYDGVGLPGVGPAAPVFYRRFLYRYPPEKHPACPWLVAMAAHVQEPLGYMSYDPGTITPFLRQAVANTADTARPAGRVNVAVTYRFPGCETQLDDSVTNNPVNSEIQRWVIRKPGPAGENLRIKFTNPLFKWVLPPGTPISSPAAGWVTGSDSIPLLGWAFADAGVAEDTTIPVTKDHLVYTWKMVPFQAIPRAADLLMGFVNYQGGGSTGPGTTRFDNELAGNFNRSVIRSYQYAGGAYSAAMGFQEGTLLYLYYEISEPYLTVSGFPVVDIDYHFLHRPQGHNCHFSIATNRFVRMARPLLAPVGSWVANQPPIRNGAYPAGMNYFDYADLTSLFKIDYMTGDS